MVALKTFNMTGTAQDAVEVNAAVFDTVSSDTLVHDVVVGMLAAIRQGTHDTKGRAEVSGGGRKPFGQKGTGRARRGSSRDPLLRGGGTIFGPTPRSYRTNITVSMKRNALCGLLSDRARSERLCVLENLTIDQPKTKVVVNMLDSIVPERRRTLLVTAEYDKNVLLSSRNMQNINVRTAAEVSALDVIRASHVILQKEAVSKLEERLT
ncbi:MAG: 50S ribosomal protein L4 [Candidatus Hydrogenedentes bacterium]|nr:50S ribosomal protein L4 [Candidatus Hydrogenedentota bacterium]